MRLACASYVFCVCSQPAPDLRSKSASVRANRMRATGAAAANKKPADNNKTVQRGRLGGGRQKGRGKYRENIRLVRFAGRLRVVSPSAILIFKKIWCKKILAKTKTQTRRVWESAYKHRHLEAWWAGHVVRTWCGGYGNKHCIGYSLYKRMWLQHNKHITSKELAMEGVGGMGKAHFIRTYLQGGREGNCTALHFRFQARG